MLSPWPIHSAPTWLIQSIYPHNLICTIVIYGQYHQNRSNRCPHDWSQSTLLLSWSISSVSSPSWLIPFNHHDRYPIRSWFIVDTFQHGDWCHLHYLQIYHKRWITFDRSRQDLSKLWIAGCGTHSWNNNRTCNGLIIPFIVHPFS